MDASSHKGFAVLTPRQRAESARKLLSAAGLLDPDHRVRRDERGVAFPVTDPRGARPVARRLGARVVPLDDPVPRTPRDPRERARRRLRDRAPDAPEEALPTGWRRLGGTVIVDLPEPLEPWADEAAAALGEALDADAVVAEGHGVDGPLRTPTGRALLWGDSAETVHREDGLAYHLDPTEVMFSAGNETERARMGQLEAAGETVADLFAGVGYFTIPLAARAGAEAVVAVDRNPTSLGYLARNAEANGVDGRVHPVRADSRRLGGTDWADRVVMGYLPDPSDALPAALGVLRPGGRLHYHRTASRKDGPEAAAREVRQAASEAGAEAEVQGTRTVKSVGPAGVHVVVDATIG